MKKIAACSKNPVFDWDCQARQYPLQGKGIEYFQGNYGEGHWVDCLLFYDDNRQLVGILNHYPFAIFPYQKKGSVNIQIRKDKRRGGIATVLLDEAIKRFQINFKKQDYTQSGKRFIKSFMRTSPVYKSSKNSIKI